MLGRPQQSGSPWRKDSAGSGGKEACLRAGPNLSAARAVVDGGYHGPFGQKSLLLRDRFVVTGGTGGGVVEDFLPGGQHLRFRAGQADGPVGARVADRPLAAAVTIGLVDQI